MRKTMRRVALVAASWCVLCANLASAEQFQFEVSMTQDQVPPPTGSAAVGTMSVFYDTETNFMTVDGEVTDLSLSDLNPVAQNSPFHLHLGGPGEIGAIAVILGDLNSWVEPIEGLISVTVSPPVVVPEEVEADLLAGLTYLNLHTQAFPGGEIRGDIMALPEPRGAALTSFVLGALGLLRRRQRAECPARRQRPSNTRAEI